MNDIALTAITLIVTVALGLSLQENKNHRDNEKVYAEIVKMNKALLEEHCKIIEVLNSVIERSKEVGNEKTGVS